MLFIGIIIVIILNVSILILIVKELRRYYIALNEKRFKMKVAEIRDKERIQFIHIISSELHDNISQMISLAVMNAKAINIANFNQKSIENIVKLLSRSLTDIRHLNTAIKLRESSDIDLDYQIEELIEFLNCSSSIRFKRNGPAPKLSSERKYLLLRILQELLHNILKYSNACDVELYFEIDLSSVVRICITHDGVIFKPSNDNLNMGSGLKNICENVKLLGAQIIYCIDKPKIEIKLPLLRDFRDG